MAKNGQVQIGPGTFPAGTQVELHQRVADSSRGKAEKTVKVGGDSTASFTGLEPGRQYYVEGDVDGRRVVVAATAKAKGAPAPQVQDPEQVRANLKAQALDQGSTLAPPVEGMRSTATAAPPKPTDQAEINKATAESAQRTARDLAKQDIVDADSVDRTALAEAQQIVRDEKAQKKGPASRSSSSGDAAARKRSAAAKKAARTRKRNEAAARRSRSAGRK